MIIQKNIPLSGCTTFRIGGNARYIVCPERREDVPEAIEFAKEKGLPCFVLGNGSNVLVSDAGIRGLVIMTDRLSRVTFREDGTVEAASQHSADVFRAELEKRKGD